ncbi:FUSC family protein [Legionella sp. km772]|uniref:FUSC family protein n=1 Tax=Legionella sp. km772 TaxID=2498111 RepID=UPI000F8F2FDB|nr:FUSC family protein [Legionella sp. km772]RUR08647.1 FUSC family protein [Legionella sp. km772]
MFISQLKDKILTYDKYGEHRTNGLKILFVLQFLFLFNYIYGVNNPYFYFFYVPLTAFTAEIIGSTLEEKYLFLFCTITGCALSIFLFGLFSVYKLFFVFFVFFYSLFLYYLVIHHLRKMLALVPLILSLAVYSLIYENADSNLYIALNHVLEVLVAMGLIFMGLYLFPKRYYFVIWQRAFLEVLSKLEFLSEEISQENVQTIPIFPGIIVMNKYSKMLPRSINYYSVLKITLLSFELIMSLSYLLSFRKKIKTAYIQLFTRYIKLLLEACKRKKTVLLGSQDHRLLTQSYELKTLRRLILSWNYLCTDL